jgi:hypothetical protein
MSVFEFPAACGVERTYVEYGSSCLRQYFIARKLFIKQTNPIVKLSHPAEQVEKKTPSNMIAIR